jgi:hypothetical protein
MLQRVRRVGVGQVAKVLGVLYLALGFIFGVCIWLFSSLAPSTTGASPFFGMGLAALIVIPIVYAIIGVVFGAITAVIYNLVAGAVGGIELDLEPSA